MSNLGGVPHNGKGPASVDFADWSQVGIILENIQKEDMAVRFNPGKIAPDPEPLQAFADEQHMREAIREHMQAKFPTDKINPTHYCADGIECHSVQRAVLGAEGMAAYWHGCAIKYLFRSLKKNGAEDIRKAIRCLQFWLDENDGKSNAAQ